MNILYFALAGLAGLLVSGIPIYWFLTSKLKACLTANQQLSTEAFGLREELGRERILKAGLEERVTRIPDLETEIALREVKISELQNEVNIFHQMQTKLETEMDAKERSFREQIELLVKAKEELSKAFAEVSQGALERNNKMFLDLAQQNLAKINEQNKCDLEQKQMAIDNLIKPIRESLEKVDVQIKDLGEKGAGITEQLKGLAESERRLQGETANLVKALRNPNQRGRWGEIQLKRVVEMAGMLEKCDFTSQETTRVEGGAIRPDLTIHLPGNRRMVVDSKVPLDAYLSATEATDDETRLGYLKQHGRQLREQVRQLASKKYWDQFSETPEMVIMFVPGESMYSAALEQDPTLIEYGVASKVLIATPVTLIGLLRAVSHGWRQEKLEENALKISELGKELYSRISKMTDHFGTLGKHLDRAVSSYNSTVGSMEGRVLVQARRFKELQASTHEDIEEVETVNQRPRLPADSELPKPKVKTETISLFEAI